MKWTSREPLTFNDNGYTERARNMSAHALWTRQCKKSRTKVTATTGITFSTMMLIPTMGVSTLGLAANSRTLAIARRKKKIIDAEARRRNLPDYEKTKRDILIPLGVSLTVFATVGLLDILFFAGTSAPVLNGVAEHGINALSAMAHDPSSFFLGLWHGAQLQVHQVFQHGDQMLALTPDPGHAVTGAGALHGANHGATANPIDAPTLAAFQARAAENVHTFANLAGSSHPAPLLAADKGIELAAASHANAAELSGANVGVSIMETAETYAVRYTIADTGLLDVAPNSPEKHVDANAAAQNSRVQMPGSIGRDAKLAQKAVLTGESSSSFLILSKEYRPVSQWVMTPKESCTHDDKKSLATTTCTFCPRKIDPVIQAYYHCCSCSDSEESASSSYDICEVCVAGRGCSCPYREDHIIHRKGLLGETIDFGNLSD